MAFFLFLCAVVFILFFDYYWVMISRALKEPSRETEKAAGQFLKMGEGERKAIFSQTRALLDAGRVEEARQVILNYLQRENSAEGNYLAGLVYMSQGDVNSAYRSLKESVRLQPDYYAAQQKLAEVYVIVGDLKSAQEAATNLSKQTDHLEDGLLIQSEIALAEGNLDEALRKAESAAGARKSAGADKTLIQLASLYAKKGNRSKAEEIVVKIDEKRLNASDLLMLSRYYQATGRSEKASALLNGALARYPNSPEVHYFYGQQLFNQGKYRESIPHYQKVYASMPHSRIASYRYGQALMASGQIKEAKEHVDTVLSRYPNDILALSLKVRYELLKGQRQDAINTLKQTTDLVPDAPRPHTLLAEIYWAEGILTVAEGHAQKALKLGEKSISPRIVLGDIFFKKGQYAKALEQYGKILERDPVNLIALSQSADAYLNMGEAKKAESLYEKIILQYPAAKVIRTKLEMVRNVPKGPAALLETAFAYYQRNPDDMRAVSGYVQTLQMNRRIPEAMEVLKKAIAKNPRNVQYPVMLGDLYLAQRNVAAAKDVFHRALQLAPNDLNLLINIGGRYERYSLDKDAEDMYLSCQRLYPGNMLIVNQLAWFYTDKRGELEKARPYIDTLRVRGEGAFEKDTVGWFYYKLGDYNSAEAFSREALQMDPDNNVIRGHFALALHQLGRKKDAALEAEKAARLLPPGDLKNRLVALMQQKKGPGK